MSTSESEVRAAITVQENGGQNNPWPMRLDNWKKFSEKFHERGRSIETRYEDDRDANSMTVGTGLNDIGGKKVNLFFSNTTIIKESLFNSLPKPDVKRLHFGDWDNDVARVAALIVQRGLTYEVQNAPDFKVAIEMAILDRLVPGYGGVWVEFKTAEQAQYSGGLMTAKAQSEYICVEPVYWADLLWEPGRTWEKAMWKGRKLHVETSKAKARWGEDAIQAAEQRKAPNAVSTGEQAMMAGTVCVLQIWDMESRNVIHMTEDGHVLSSTPDPYRLRKFFPCPKPLMANPATRRFAPLADYYMAQDQYSQMDTLYSRINLIIQAIRVAGVYDASVPAIGRMLSGTENKLIPVDNWAMFAEKGGTKGVIDWFPVEQVAQVLVNLTNTYGFIKTELYEVTGMSDIVRGSSNQYETLGAQQIKAQFASVRLNGYQRDVSEFVTEILNIMAELMVQLYSRERLSAICGQLPTDDQKYVEPALALLQNDFLSQCNISIEADSLTQADWGLEQQQRMSVVQSLSSFIQSALPVAESSPALAPMLMSIIKFAMMGFKGAAELEGSLDAALEKLKEVAGQPKPPSPEEIKAQTEAQKAEREFAIKQQEFQMEQQQAAQELQMDREKQAAELMFKREQHMQDLQFEREKHMQSMQFEREKADLQAGIKLAESAAKIKPAGGNGDAE